MALQYVMHNQGNIPVESLAGSTITAMGGGASTEKHLINSARNVDPIRIATIDSCHIGCVGNQKSADAFSKYNSADYAVELNGVTGVAAKTQTNAPSMHI